MGDVSTMKRLLPYLLMSGRLDVSCVVQPRGQTKGTVNHLWLHAV